MRRVTRNGVIAVAAASGAMALTLPVTAAFAADGALADGATADSGGVLSGNTVQVPVHAPVNVCGNTVNVVGLLNSAVGNTCFNKGGGSAAHAGKTHGGEAHAGKTHGSETHGGEARGSETHGGGKDSSGILSGNVVQVPVHAPVNISGNTVNGVGIGNDAIGNESTNGSGHHARHHCTEPASKPSTPSASSIPSRTVQRPTPARHAAPPRYAATLAHTGADQTLPAAVASGALILGGAAVYRRFRPAPTR
jgi:LPXTG-motif cell wall-anchored protein